MVSRVGIRNEDSGNVAAVGGSTDGDAGQLLGGRHARGDPQYGRCCAHRVSNPGGLAIDDGDDDNQPGPWHPLGCLVFITHGDPQAP